MRPRPKPAAQGSVSLPTARAADLWRAIARDGYKLPAPPATGRFVLPHDRICAARLERVVAAVTAGRPAGTTTLLPGWRRTLEKAGLL